MPQLISKSVPQVRIFTAAADTAASLFPPEQLGVPPLYIPHACRNQALCRKHLPESLPESKSCTVYHKQSRCFSSGTGSVGTRGTARDSSVGFWEKAYSQPGERQYFYTDLPSNSRFGLFILLLNNGRMNPCLNAFADAYVSEL